MDWLLVSITEIEHKVKKMAEILSVSWARKMLLCVCGGAGGFEIGMPMEFTWTIKELLFSLLSISDWAIGKRETRENGLFFLISPWNKIWERGLVYIQSYHFSLKTQMLKKKKRGQMKQSQFWRVRDCNKCMQPN